jgi:outer membrane protein OmpA-like peptidoglycan-associated protein
LVTVSPEYVQGESSRRDITLYVDGEITPNENLDEDGDPIKSAIKFKVNLRPRAEPYKVRVVVQTKFQRTALGRSDCPQAGVLCEPSEAQADLYVTNTPPTLTLEPPKIGPISAQRPQTLSLTAKAEDADRDPLTLSWSAPSEIVLSGSDSDSVRSFTTGNLQAGRRYRVTARVSDGTEPVERSAEIVVNNPPTVELHSDHPNLLGVAPGDPLKLIAAGNDLEHDPLSYSWQLSGTTTDGNAVSRSLSNDSPSNPVFAVPTQELEPGKYMIAVTASDSLDTSRPAEVAFEVVRRAPQIFFEFDKYRLLQMERKKLDEEALWLGVDQNRTIEIRCEGNADLIGKPNYNLRLGCQRACKAKSYLTKRGIAPERIIIAVSFGERRADQQRQRATDRRVDLTYARRAGVVTVVPVGAESCDCGAVFNAVKKRAKVSRR